MPKPQKTSGNKNLIGQRLIALRKAHNFSQRDLAYKLQLSGCDLDKNAITKIETNNRYVSDIEIRALGCIFGVSYDYLMEGKVD